MENPQNLTPKTNTTATAEVFDEPKTLRSEIRTKLDGVEAKSLENNPAEVEQWRPMKKEWTKQRAALEKTSGLWEGQRVLFGTRFLSVWDVIPTHPSHHTVAP